MRASVNFMEISGSESLAHDKQKSRFGVIYLLFMLHTIISLRLTIKSSKIYLVLLISKSFHWLILDFFHKSKNDLFLINICT